MSYYYHYWFKHIYFQIQKALIEHFYPMHNIKLKHVLHFTGEKKRTKEKKKVLFTWHHKYPRISSIEFGFFLNEFSKILQLTLEQK